MKIAHVAIWASDIEAMKDFYIKYFEMTCGEKYTNNQKQFSSYFLSFKDNSAKIELMHRPDIFEYKDKRGNTFGLAHIAISTGSKELVISMTEKLRADNFIIHGEPRTTGDGYYESVVLDPEGNIIEITV